MPKVGKAKDLAVTPNGVETTTTPMRVKTKPHPRLVNRGPAGLLHKTKSSGGEITPAPVDEKAELTKAIARNRIAPPLRASGLVVPIDSLTPDPQNARVHGDRNIESIKLSLTLYGQLKPIVVRKASMTVVAGNGTLESAKILGWTEIAATIVDMNEVEAVGYGLADNRTAELAKWNFEVVARLDKILQAAGQEAVGWTKDELEVLRAAEWTPPAVDDTQFGGGGDAAETDPLMVSFTPDEYAHVGKAISEIRKIQKQPELSQAGALADICREWLKLQQSGRLEEIFAEIEAASQEESEPVDNEAEIVEQEEDAA